MRQGQHVDHQPKYNICLTESKRAGLRVKHLKLKCPPKSIHIHNKLLNNIRVRGK